MRFQPLVLVLALGCTIPGDVSPSAQPELAQPVAAAAAAPAARAAHDDDDFFLGSDADDIVAYDPGARNHGPMMRAGTVLACWAVTPTTTATATQVCVNTNDADSDGYGDYVDCNDGNSSIYPGAPETPGDGVDQDCNGYEICFADADGDGYGVAQVQGNLACNLTSMAANGGDCDDGTATTSNGYSVHPGATEVAGDGIDQNCDGKELCYVDQDGDGHAGSTTALSTDTDCLDAAEFTLADDCVDAGTMSGVAAADIFPGQVEVCNEVDDDCDTNIDDEDMSRVGPSWYQDVDDDGYGVTAGAQIACIDPGAGWVDASGDCDDADAAVSPGATEVVDNGVDDDCDGTVDEGGPDDTDVGDTEVGGDTDVTPGDTDETPDDGKDGKCGCDTSPAPTGLSALLGLLAFARRRRRS